MKVILWACLLSFSTCAAVMAGPVDKGTVTNIDAKGQRFTVLLEENGGVTFVADRKLMSTDRHAKPKSFPHAFADLAVGDYIEINWLVGENGIKYGHHALIIKRKDKE